MTKYKQVFPRRSAAMAIAVLSCIWLSGCTSFAKGVTQAVLESEKKDSRLCEITGPAFEGVMDSLDHIDKTNPPRHTKILMVHGIGKHLPDYSARFLEKLTRTLNLDSVDPVVRQINLTDSEEQLADAGILRVSRHFSSKNDHELFFYELTWSGIADEDREVIAFDSSAAYSYRRAGFNKSLKSFMNATVPDLLVYEGSKKPLIDKAVGQSVCWMFSRQWDVLPKSGAHYCDFYDDRIAEDIRSSNYYVVTHSLGSRITIDTFNNFALMRDSCEECKKLKKIDGVLKDRVMTVFMLANQLPLLQVGQAKPVNTGLSDRYCSPTGAQYDERLIGKTRIVAFSDPNDILSYPVPIDYAREYIDSRMCPEVINVDINIATVNNAFGLTTFANPLDAHSGYQEDDRVVQIIASGLHRERMHPVIADRCHWTEVTTGQK